MEEINFLFTFAKKVLTIVVNFFIEEKKIPSNDLVITLHARHLHVRSDCVNGFSLNQERIWIQRKIECEKRLKNFLWPSTFIINKVTYFENFKEIEFSKIRNLFDIKKIKKVPYRINEILYNLEIKKAGQL